MSTYEQLMEKARVDYDASILEAEQLREAAREIGIISEDSDLLEHVVNIRMAAREKFKLDREVAEATLYESNT